MDAIPVADVLTYICATYPHKSELSNARITKMVYLSDWAAARAGDGQLTNIQWVFYMHGPWVPDVIEAAKHDPRLKVVGSETIRGSAKRLVSLNPDTTVDVDSVLPAKARAYVDLVIADTENMYFNEFVDYVYNTVPVRATSRYGTLDLPKLAAEVDAGDLQPPDLAAAGIAPTDYARVRDLLSTHIARAILGERASTFPTEVNRAKVREGADFVIRQFSFDPQVAIQQASNGWVARWRGTAEAIATVGRDHVPAAGFSLVDPEWDDDDDALIQAPLNVEGTHTVRRLADNFDVISGQITLTTADERAD